MSFDYMHAILLGAGRFHTFLILECIRKKFWQGMEEDRIGMDHLEAAIDIRLKNITPPTSLTRVPRSIKDRKLWKASEWRAWLLFYFFVCLQGLIKEKYLYHFAMLSEALSILLQPSITPEDIQRAHVLLMTYTYYFQKYFGENEMVYNLHLLRHAAPSVTRFGPLWTHDAFLYEGQNHFVLKMMTSPSNVLVQVAQRFLIYKTIPDLCIRYASWDETLNFCEEVMTRSHKNFVRCDGTVLLGKGEPRSFSAAEKESLLKKGIAASECVVYNRMLFMGRRFTSRNFSTLKQNDDSFVMLQSGKAATIIEICYILNRKVLLLVFKSKIRKTLPFQNQHVSVKHILEIKDKEDIDFIEPQQVKCHCVLMKRNDMKYISEISSGVSGD
jgi:hypothetical protein